MAGFFSDIFGGGAEKQAAGQDQYATAVYNDAAQKALQSGYATGTQAINQGIGAYQPLVGLGQTYAAGAPTYMAGLGVGTPQQIQQAQNAFTQSPGYAAVVKQAADAVARQRAIGGMGASGNADIGAILGTTGVTQNAYQTWLQNMLQSQQLGAQTTAAGAQGTASQYDALANLAKGFGENQAGVYGNVLQSNIGANNLAAAGEAAGAKNLLNAGMSLATLGMGGNPFGGSLTGKDGGGFGSSLLGQAVGGLGNLFGGGGGGAASAGVPGSPYYGPQAPFGYGR